MDSDSDYSDDYDDYDCPDDENDYSNSDQSDDEDDQEVDDESGNDDSNSVSEDMSQDNDTDQDSNSASNNNIDDDDCPVDEDDYYSNSEQNDETDEDVEMYDESVNDGSNSGGEDINISQDSCSEEEDAEEEESYESCDDNSEYFDSGSEESSEESFNYNNNNNNMNYKSNGNYNYNSYFKDLQQVLMPSGTFKPLSIMIKTCRHDVCDYSDFQLLDLARGMTERNIIEAEMNGTIMQHQLREHGGGIFRSYNILEVKKIYNPCLWRMYCQRADYFKNQQLLRNWSNQVKMLFHGTTVTAANSIAKYGFDITKANFRGMFGPAIYFAEHSSKSNQYAYGYLGGNGCPQHMNKNCYACPRTMLLCRVVTGNEVVMTSSGQIDPNRRTYTTVRGVPSFGGLQYPEYVVFNKEQIYPEYLITYTIVA